MVMAVRRRNQMAICCAFHTWPWSLVRTFDVDSGMLGQSDRPRGHKKLGFTWQRKCRCIFQSDDSSQLPHGLLAVSIATTFIPDLARFAAKNDSVGFAHHMFRGVRLTAMLTFPAAAGLLVLSRPTIGLVLQHGNFSANAGVNTSRALAGLSIGLIGFSLYLFALRGFYAHNDTRTPFFINLGENALNILFAFLLVGRYGVLGLGIAFSLAYKVQRSGTHRVAPQSP